MEYSRVGYISTSDGSAPLVHPAGTAGNLLPRLAAPGIHPDRAWHGLELPLLEDCLDPDQVLATLLWQAPAGTAPERVLVDMNSVTDHHHPEPAVMSRPGGGPLHVWQAHLPRGWCGSYGFIPLGPEGRRAPHEKQHAWWLRIQPASIADPANPRRAFPGGWGAPRSALLVPPVRRSGWAQQAWDMVDRDVGVAPEPARLRRLTWNDRTRNGVGRVVWLFRTGAADRAVPSDGDPLVVCLDGRRWALDHPLFPVLDQETARGALPPASFVLVDNGDGNERAADLGCNDSFWTSLRHGLLPMLDLHWPVTRAPERTVLAGQSLGGLSALSAALRHPDWFGSVLSQSGSFWWPDPDLLHTPAGASPFTHRRPGSRGTLQGVADRRTPSRLRVLLQVGDREGVMIDVNQTMHESLARGGHETRLDLFQGGHDAVCWRAGLVQGLRELLPRAATPQALRNPN